MSNDILFVTSFNRAIYEQTGSGLIRSFVKEQKCGRLLVCDEGMPDGQSYPDRCDRANLDDSGWLHDWLSANRDVIPDYIGGLARECDCEQRHRMHGEHKTGCHWSWMNRNASRFFRKVAALRISLSMMDAFRYVIWIDADCRFINTLWPEQITHYLQGQSFFYFRAHREAPETGIIGFDVEAGGMSVVVELCRRYESREYLKNERWDDGYQLGRMIDAEIVTGHDVAADYTCKNNHVMTFTSMWKIIRHRKGSHGRLMENKGLKPIMR